MGRRGGVLSNDELLRAVAASKAVQPGFSAAPIEIKHNFVDFAVSDLLKKNIVAKGYTNPTPIQDQAIPLMLEGKDIIGIANTGTGKTAAFLIPLIEKVSKDKTQRVLIVTPTRELALQIRDEFFSFARGLNLFSALCIGGANMFYQKKSLMTRPNFVIGTPGRIKDLMRQNALNLSDFNNVVLDETDRMVDIGFLADIKYFISFLPKQRQSVFFSATVSPKVQEIIHSFVQNPITISVKNKETAGNVTQEVVNVAKRAKINVLHDFLIKEEFKKTLIFGRTKHGVEKLNKELAERGFKVGSIHGDKRQPQRERVLRQFRSNEIQILLATDVASRGLDINDVSHVINYDLPESYDDYVHRIGRTGRGDKKGIALTFLEVD